VHLAGVVVPCALLGMMMLQVLYVSSMVEVVAFFPTERLTVELKE
jgi:hypothetical protein